jgi:hypothetical protein
MAGRKHHYIQRLLLRGFSFNESQSPCHVWVYRKDGKTFASALEGYGAERDFYGSPESPELDGEITEIESGRFNDFLRGVRDGNDRDLDSVEATAFAVHVFFRSKNFRSILTAGLEPLMERAQSRLGDPQILEQLFSSGIRQNAEQALKAVENAGGLHSNMASNLKYVRENSQLYARQFMATSGRQIKQLLDALQNRVSDFVAAGHRKSLRERLRDFSGTRIEQLQALHWRVMIVDGPLILGDSVVLAELADGSFKSISEPGDDLARVWIPVCHIGHMGRI